MKVYLCLIKHRAMKVNGEMMV